MQAHTKKFTIFKICTPNYGEFPSIIKKGNWSGIQTFIRQKDCSHKDTIISPAQRVQTCTASKEILRSKDKAVRFTEIIVRGANRDKNSLLGGKEKIEIRK